MTPQEYRTKLDALKKQELELAEEFIKDNPFKELEGKLVNLTIGCSHQKVLFVGASLSNDNFLKTKNLVLFYHKLNKDGRPRKNAEKLEVYYYDGKLHKIEKICRTQK